MRFDADMSAIVFLLTLSPIGLRANGASDGARRGKDDGVDLTHSPSPMCRGFYPDRMPRGLADATCRYGLREGRSSRRRAVLERVLLLVPARRDALLAAGSGGLPA
jgi:hypothetical protein